MSVNELTTNTDIFTEDIFTDTAPSDDMDVESNTSLSLATKANLNNESLAIIEKIITETDEQKAKDLTHLFNVNQNKKTMVRVNKLSDLLDTITDQAVARFTSRPDEISNKELFDGLKIVQDLIERGQKQVSGVNDVITPLIQVNQQTNEVNIGSSASNLNRDSRERVKAAVLDLLGSINAQQFAESQETPTIIETDTYEEEVNDGW